MGRKAPVDAKEAAAVPVPDDDDKEEEDTPVIKELKTLDDEYLALEREYQKEVDRLKEQYAEKMKPFLEDRAKLLLDAKDNNDAPKTGTPGLKGFWLQALKNHPAFEEVLEEHDEPVLEYLQDITKEVRAPGVPESQGFKLHFKFLENPFFEQTVLTKEYHVREVCPYSDSWEVTEIKCTEIKWKDGKDVTVDLNAKAKKTSKKGGKKASGKVKEEDTWRTSIFRSWFRNLKNTEELPKDLAKLMLEGVDEDEEEDADFMQEYMDNDHEVGTAVRDELIPFAVRWYTGEASPSDDEDDEDEESEEEDDDDDSESEEEESPKGKKGGKPAAKGGKAGGDPKAKEECKQQ